MPLFVLFRKNFIYWKRYKTASILEIVVPILLCIIMAAIKNTVPSSPGNPNLPYNNPGLTPSLIQSLPNITFPNRAVLTNLTKNCYDSKKGGYIALSPEFAITDSLRTLFSSLGLQTRFFASNTAINAEVLSQNYTMGNYSGFPNQICFGVVFDSYTNNNFTYSLRYNISSSGSDHYATQSATRVQFKIEDMISFNKTRDSGSLNLQILVDSLIIQQTTGVVVVASFEKFKTNAYSFTNFTGTLLNMVPLLLIICSMISFLRIISHVVGERESRGTENMENMGMSKGTYLLSIYLFMMLVQFCIAIIVAIILKVGILSNVNWFLLFLMYFLFMMANISIALFVSCFFSNTKRAIITGLIVFLVLFLFYILKNSVTQPTKGLAVFIAITPSGALTQLITNFMQLTDYSIPFGFEELTFEVNFFAGSTFFIVAFIEWIGFTLLSFYFLYVYPLEIGLTKHPLFIFGWKQSSSNSSDFSQDDLQESVRNEDNFEEIEKEFKDQDKLNKSLKLERVSKIYANRKVAVNNLSLEIFSDQIFALLGHNGAGKTTTLSMIAGLLPITSGTIRIQGLDSNIDHDQVKQIMGVCPQANPVFEYMTVMEHMELYARLKGVVVDPHPEIERLLQEMDLWHKKDYLAGKLSGGQKRKLCVAMAFVGDSKVILLDEPTSGMDTFARRHLWEMLKKYKKGRLVILTTHNMDEADFLGDRIGIMSEGKIVTCGSPIFLKKKFGDGYEMTILKQPLFENDPMVEIQQMVFSSVAQSSLISDIGIELKFRLPENSTGFKDLFERIETQGTQMGVQSFGIDLNTLEDVFIKVAKISTGRFEINKSIDNFKPAFKSESRMENEMSRDRLVKSKNPLDMDLKSLTENNLQVSSRQFAALLKKRYLITVRDWGTILCEVICPVIIVLIGLGIAKINFFTVSPQLNITDTIYQYSQNFTGNNLLGNSADPVNALLSLYDPPAFAFNQTGLISHDNFVNLIFNQNRTSQLFAFYFTQLTPTFLNYTLMFNTTAPFVPYVAVNQLSNAILQLYSPQNMPKTIINMYLNPLALTTGIKSLNATVSGFILVILLLQAFALIPNSLIQFIVKERENNSKHQQVVSGTSVWVYWLSNFLIDYIKYLIPGLFIYAMFFAFGADFFVGGAKAGYTILLIFIYGVTLIGLTYVLSFMFKSPSNAQIFAFIFFSFVSFVLVIISFVLKVISETQTIGLEVIPYIFNLVSPFSLGNALMNLANDNLYVLIYRWSSVPGPFDQKIGLNELIYLICFGIFYCCLVFMIEFSQFLLQPFKRPGKILSSSLKKSSVQVDSSLDEDVLLEEESVKKQTKAYSVYVQDLCKIYSVPSKNFCGTGTKKKAINGVSFGVEQGSVFCLLGTNGAGKTTTFKVLTGDATATSGSVIIRGLQLPQELSAIRHLVGYCPQFDSLSEKLTAEEHLQLYCDLKGIEPIYQQPLIENMLESLNLLNYRNIRAEEYSGGNKRKLSIAIALIGHPPIVFLDEPSAGMDPEARRFMWNFIAEISSKRSHSSIILTTHSMEEAQALANKVAIMVEGRIKTIGTVQRLKDKYGRGFEIEVKLKLPSEETVLAKCQEYKILVPLKVEGFVSATEVVLLLKALDLSDLNSEVTLNGRGSAILQRLQTSGVVEDMLLVEWIEIQLKLQKVQNALVQRFDSKLIEAYQSYAKFNVGEKFKLSEIFGFMEIEVTKLEISNFAVREISLEQIFIQFAQNVVHED